MILSTIDRYIATNVIKGWFLILLIVLALFSFLELVNQLDDVGNGQYTIKDALLFVILTIPKRIVILTPVSALVGSVIALIGMANNGELIAIRAAGMSIQRIIGSLFKTGLIILVIAIAFEQWIAPPLEHKALRLYNMKTSDLDMAGNNGFWSRNKDDYVRVGEIVYGRIPSDIEVFKFNPDHRLLTYIKADNARLLGNNKWLLSDAIVKQFQKKSATQTQHKEYQWKSFLSSAEIRALEFPIDSLSIDDLSGYVNYLKSVGEPYQDHRHQLWKKISRPFSAATMVMLASLFAFGSQRTFNKGKRIIQATIVALVLYFASEIIANTGMLIGANPIVTAAAPILIMLMIVILQLKRKF